MEAYTAEELAEKARRELGADVSPRTIYFYRQAGILSPLEASGSQPRFTDRHFLELSAALALQRAPDRPTLAEVATMLRGLSEEALHEVARAVGPTARELVNALPRADFLAAHMVAESRPLILRDSLSGPPPAAPRRREGAAPPAPPPPSRGVTINLAPGVTLHVGPDAPRDLVAKLLDVSLSHIKRPGPTPEPRPDGGNRE